MFCTRCGVELEDRHLYCFKCGEATERAPQPRTPEPFMRSVTDRKIAGVCGGIAKHWGMDPTLVRLIWLLLTFGLPPAGILGYIAAWILAPVEPLRVYSEPAPAQNGL